MGLKYLLLSTDFTNLLYFSFFEKFNYTQKKSLLSSLTHTNSLLLYPFLFVGLKLSISVSSNKYLTSFFSCLFDPLFYLILWNYFGFLNLDRILWFIEIINRKVEDFIVVEATIGDRKLLVVIQVWCTDVKYSPNAIILFLLDRSKDYTT